MCYNHALAYSTSSYQLLSIQSGEGPASRLRFRHIVLIVLSGAEASKSAIVKKTAPAALVRDGISFKHISANTVAHSGVVA
jgi:hypothetical protein